MPWIERRIFPGAYPPTLRQMMDLFEPWGFSILDLENLRLHYAQTLRHWLSAVRGLGRDGGRDVRPAVRAGLAIVPGGLVCGVHGRLAAIIPGGFRPIGRQRHPVEPGSPVPLKIYGFPLGLAALSSAGLPSLSDSRQGLLAL